uniref:Putative secreted protein n=1 Tax=Anopheles darlingi TaxID=43151 RepID=A0A2M4D3B5_ANODA
MVVLLVVVVVVVVVVVIIIDLAHTVVVQHVTSTAHLRRRTIIDQRWRHRLLAKVHFRGQHVHFVRFEGELDLRR